MIMKRWRVGSLSMGIVLVASGLMMLVSLVVQINVLNILLTFWPIILICLGIEILLHLFVRKDGDTDIKMKYDVLSIIFISLILIISVLFYTATYSIGLLGSRDDMYAFFGIKTDDVHIESGIELDGTKELVIFSGFNSIRAISTSSENIRVEYSIMANTNDKEYAESIIANVIKIEEGERAYMLSNASMFYSNRRMSYPIIDCVIYLPRDKTLDLSQFYGNFEYDSMIESQIIRSYNE